MAAHQLRGVAAGDWDQLNLASQPPSEHSWTPAWDQKPPGPTEAGFDNMRYVGDLQQLRRAL